MEVAAVLVLAVSFVALLALGVPVAYAIGLATAATILTSVEPTAALTTVSQRMATGLDSFTLLAIPFFILAGQLMNRGGIAARLIDFAKSLLGTLPGGLALVNVLASMLFGAISGSAVAAASAIGTTLGPRMEAEGYDRDFSAAVNITAATTGLVIPPSNVLIVYSLASGGVSIAALFLAGYVPGIVVGGLLMTVAGVTAARRGYPVGDRVPLAAVARRFVTALPSLLLLVVVIGGIVAGVFTATEAAAVAVLYAGVLAVLYRGVGLRDLPQILLDSAATTAVVLLLIAVSVAMSWAMAYVGLPQAVSAGVGAIESPLAVFLLVNVILLVVGTFMDMTPAVLIFTPIFLPLVVALGMDPGPVRDRHGPQPVRRAVHAAGRERPVRRRRRGGDDDRPGWSGRSCPFSWRWSWVWSSSRSSPR